jgi:xyloglucan-specific exo-beta-1,4-glucanase
MNNVPKGETLNVSYDAQGSLWLVGSQGLYHATNGAASFTQINSVTSGYSISEGKAQYASNYLTLYLGGTVGGVLGIFRSIDNGNTWFRVDDAAHGYGYIASVQGDPRVFGRVYLGTGGRGIITADSPY